MAYLIMGVSTVYLKVGSGADQSKYQSPRYWPLCGNSPVTGGFPPQRASNAENVSIWRRHHVSNFMLQGYYTDSGTNWYRNNVMIDLFVIALVFEDI